MTIGAVGPGQRVIVTKVRPPRRRSDVTSRERLHDIVGGNLERKLLLVSAPAGYGKTTLLVDYAAASGLPVCWYRLEALDADPAVFMEHLVQALRQPFPDVCASTLQLVREQARSGQLDVVDAIGSLVNEIAEQVPDFFLLVLDDYQNVDDADEVNRALDALLEYLPDACQVVVCGRSVPRKLTLTRLAAAGQVAGIGAAELRFTPEEVGRLVTRLHDRQLSEGDCRRLAADTEGWATALVLIGQRLLDDKPPGVRDRDELFAFLAQEVLARQPPAVQRFLLASSILEELTPRLCDAVLERSDSAAMIDFLDSHNLFVSRLEADQEWYRYHQLFRDFLAERLHGADGSELAVLHARAASWFASAGRPEEEIRHLLAGGAFAEAADRMSTAVEHAHELGHWQTIIRWVTALPAAELERHPELVHRLGTAHSYCGDLAGALERYDWAAGRYKAAGLDRDRAAVLVRRAVVYRLLGRTADAFADAREALAIAGDETGTTAGLAHRALGGVLAVQGRMEAAVDELGAALACYDAHGERAMAANALNDLSAICQWRGDVSAAIAHAREAHDRWQSIGNLAALAISMNNLGSAYHLAGDTVNARPWLERAVETGRRSGYRRAAALAHASLGDLLCDVDDFEAGIAHYDQASHLASAIPDAALGCYVLAARAEARRLVGDLASAGHDLDRARSLLALSPTAYEQALVAYVSGTIARDAGRTAEAVPALEQAAEAFAAMGARRDEARSLLYGADAARRAGSDGPAARLQARAEAAIQDLSGQASMDPHLRRIRADARLSPPRAGRRRTEAAVREHVGRAAVGPASGEAAARTHGALVVCAFGPPRVTVSGRPVGRRQFQSAVAMELFFLLVDHPQGLAADRLILTFWPDADETRARGNLHSTVYRVRAALAERGAVLHEFERYVLRWPGELRYDVGDLEVRLDRARGTSDDDLRARLLEDALAMARGEYLEGLASPWCVERRLGLDDLLTRALLALGDARSRLRRDREAIEAYEAALARDPLREEGHRGLMRVHAAMGNRALALRQFDVCRRILADELGAEPDPATRELGRGLTP